MSRILARKSAVLALATLALLLAIPAVAGAHAYVVKTDPTSGSVLKAEPSKVTVAWDESITTGSGGTKAALGVYDGAGKRVDSGAVTHSVGDTLAVPLKPHLPDGTYTVGWKVTSADTHVVSGAFTFSIGKPSAGGGIESKLLAAEKVPLAISDGFAVVRFFNLLLILLCAGGTASLIFVLRDAEPTLRRRLWGLVAACGALLGLVAVLGIPFEAAEQNGTSLWRGFDALAISSVRRLQFGEVWLARAWLGVIIAVLAFTLGRWQNGRRAREGVLVLASLAAVAVALTPSAAGHADVDGPLTFIVDALHVLSAAAWGGGLTFLAVALLLTPRAERWSTTVRAVPRFSALAMGSVAILLMAGAANAYLEVRAFRGFVDSTYGALVLVKIGLAFPLLALGAFNNRVSVPRLRSDIGSAAVRRHFIRAIGAELLVFVSIIGVTAVLIDEAPAKDAVAESAGPFSTTTNVGPFHASVDVTPAREGSNTITISLTNSHGRPAQVAAVTLSASLPSRSLGPLNYTATKLGNGRFKVSQAQLQISGSWRVQIGVRQGQFNEWLKTIPVSIGN